MQLEFAELRYLAPELTLVIAFVVLILLDLVMPKKWHRAYWFGGLTLLGLAISTVFVFMYIGLYNGPEPSSTYDAIKILNGSYRVDDFANLIKLVILVGTGLVALLSMGSMKKEEISHPAEYFYLLLPAVLGGMVMVSSTDLITLYIGLEVLSITSYVLVGIKKKNHLSAEAAFKYLVLGSIASAFILYGMSFLYGVTGSVHLSDIREGLLNILNPAMMEFDPSMSGLVYLSFFLMLVGFCFKISVAPFHAWTPDVYQGAPTPITSFLSVVSKAARIAFMFRILYNVYFGVGMEGKPIGMDMFLTLSVVAAAAMILGNAMALKQRNLKRLLAYSTIANAGYLLVPVSIAFGSAAVSVHYSNFSEMYFYLVAYLFMNIGAFAVIMAVSRVVGHEQLSSFAGLYYRAPWLAIGTVILLLSLAGLPVTGGFFGKFYIMLGAVSLHEYWLAAVMIITSVASFYYYFGWISQMFMRSNAPSERIRVPWTISTVIWICTVATLLMGFFPNVLFSYIDSAFSIYKDFFSF